MRVHFLVSIVFFLGFCGTVWAQKEEVDFSSPKKYEIAEVKIAGVKYLQPTAIIKLTGLQVGNKIMVPGQEIPTAIDKLWKQGLFADVNIYAHKVVGDKIYLTVWLKERPRMNVLTIKGVKKGEIKDIKDKINLPAGIQITDNIIQTSVKKIIALFQEKGFYNVSVRTEQLSDSTNRGNFANLTFWVNKGSKIKINDIVFNNNDALSDKKLRGAMKETKRKTWYNIFKRSKYLPAKYEEDKVLLLKKYKSKGYRDAEILKDTVYQYNEKLMQIEMTLKEGPKYFFRNISWVGNTKYKSDLLTKMLGIKKGDVYNEELLNDKIFGLEGVSSLYLDNGYLFFNADPVEVLVQNDSIDVEVRIYEGRQATINKIIVNGNHKTKDYVILREIRTRPGELFSRADIIRTQRELAQLGYFDPEKMGINPKPNQEDGTVDIEYTVEEKSSDQVEVSGGWSGLYFVGSIRLLLNNLSIGDGFKKGGSFVGGGQQFSISGSSSYGYYQSLSASFTEPWLGGRKPNALSTSAFFTQYASSSSMTNTMQVIGSSVGLGRRLKWPDDYFTLYNQVGFQYYNLKGYALPGIVNFPSTGTARNLNFQTTLGRSSVDQPLYPRTGSSFSLGLELTVPYSLFRTNSQNAQLIADKQQFKWLEYHKWTFKSEFYTNPIAKLVFQTKVQYGVLGSYNTSFKSPFEGYSMGGDGMTGYRMYGVSLITLRGYQANNMTPTTGANMYAKYCVEMRYPISLNPSATIYGLTFLEAGNAWTKFREFNPFSVKRSAGFGIRLFLPMMGLLGFDMGYGFDNAVDATQPSGWQTHFILGQQF